MELFVISRLFLQIPWEYGGMGNLIGKHYEATKDYLEWNGLEVKEWTPIITQMGRVWAKHSKKKG